MIFLTQIVTRLTLLRIGITALLGFVLNKAIINELQAQKSGYKAAVCLNVFYS
ncbi:hypothetical protein PspMM1_32430 [Pseudoalteromonas sp. MM1]|nr:hypothetical protein PspMM1_32430 [Pseudoalteromonas sp. MM1]